MEALIHKTAIVEPGSTLGEKVSVGPYAVIEKGACIGDGSVVESHVVVKKWARIGEAVKIGHFSVVGGDPQHLGFDHKTESFVSIGSKTRLGEGVTVHRSIYDNQSTKIGSDGFLMGNSHVAHDSSLGDRVVLANGVLLGGHVQIGEDVFVGGGTAIHQFVRIGSGAMVGGLAEISQDVGPQLLVMGRNHTCGLNNIGLRRRNVAVNDIHLLKRLYRELLYAPVNVSKIAKEHLDNLEDETSQIIRSFLEFFISGDRGFARNQK